MKFYSALLQGIDPPVLCLQKTSGAKRLGAFVTTYGVFGMLRTNGWSSALPFRGCGFGVCFGVEE